MTILAEKNLCSGCAACMNKCTRYAIVMKADTSGFLYPEVDTKLCIECGACTLACPIITKIKKEATNDIHAYIMQNLNETIRKESTSGGAFSSIAETIIDMGGVVFGAAFSSDFVVRHTYVETKEELAIFRNSKYVQSEIGCTFQEVKKFLKDDRWVCYSGTPCQIHGLFGYLGNINKNRLITVDLVCHCVPSPLIFRKYVDYQKKHVGTFDNLVFRDKKLGYSYSTMALYRGKECTYRNGSESDLWFRAFLHGFCDRESCSSCKAQEWPRHSDITIWDCFVVRKIDKDFDDNLGTTSVVTWSDKGLSLIQRCKNVKKNKVPATIFRHKIEREHFDDLMIVNKEQMYYDAHILDSDAFFKKYLPISTKIKVRRILRILLFKSGFYNIVKRIIR